MKKNFIYRAAATLLLCVCVVLGMNAQSPKSVKPTPKKTVVVNGENVRLRLEPSLQAGWLHDTKGNPIHAPKGAKLEYKGEKGDFYYVIYKSNNVYISKKFSYIEGEGGQTAQSGKVVQAGRTTEPTAATANVAVSGEEGSGDTYVVLKGTNVRLRLGPGTNYGIYNQPDTDKPYYLPKGSKLIYLGEQRNGFYKAQHKGKIVYVSAEFSYLSD